MRRILIVHTWGIGDWLFFTPVITVLKETWPDVHIEVILGKPGTRNIVEHYPQVHIRAVTDVRKGPWSILKAVVKTWHQKYDALIFTAGVDSRKADKLAFLINAKKKLALRTSRREHHFLTQLVDYDVSLHKVENNLKVLDLLAITHPKNIRPFLPFDKAFEAIPKSILIHPGSDSNCTFKRWPVERFASVAEKLIQRNWTVSVVLGPGEEELSVAFTGLRDYNKFRIYQNLTLTEVSDVICKYEVFLNNDSGLGNMAAALGKKVVSIFGPGDPTLTRPYGNHCVIIRTARKLECMPCMRPGGLYGCSKALCVADIGVDVVTKVLLEEPILQKKIQVMKFEA